MPIEIVNPCIEGFKPCNDGSCVLASKFCDDVIDCADGSDELYCEGQSLLEVSK